jgi:hypothetical protein
MAYLELLLDVLAQLLAQHLSKRRQGCLVRLAQRLLAAAQGAGGGCGAQQDVGGRAGASGQAAGAVLLRMQLKRELAGAAGGTAVHADGLGGREQLYHGGGSLLWAARMAQQVGEGGRCVADGGGGFCRAVKVAAGAAAAGQQLAAQLVG